MLLNCGHHIFNHSPTVEVRAVKGTIKGAAGTVTATPGNVVAHDWVLRPSGIEIGEEFRLLFVTSNTRNARSSDIADYNAFVQARAAACHTNIRPHSDQFRVLGSTESVSARDNTRPNPYGNGVAIWWLNGPRVATDYNDFYDGSWSNSKPTKNERGQREDFHAARGQRRHLKHPRMDGTNSNAGLPTNLNCHAGGTSDAWGTPDGKASDRGTNW